MARIYIDNEPYEAGEGQSLLQACLSLGFDIPYFCWHPAMHSVGACRQCAVKLFRDEKDEQGKIVMSCMTAASDGVRLSIDDPEAKAFRAAMIELLMLNHPHDCPVCDEGGECHLQDMTVMTGHVYRRSRFRKRTYRNQDLGPFLNHEMNRCIHCYRCVRFYREYAGGRDFEVFASHNRVYFGRHADGVLESEFSGNLVEVCPTGVFTDKSMKRHYTRKWDLQTAPSICVHCGLGCNTIPGERYGTLRRIHSRYNGEVNGYFLCDRGRYGYEFVNSVRRIRQALMRSSGPGDSVKPVTEESALEHLSALLHFGARVIGIGSPRASLEANFALRSLVGAENFYSGVSEHEFRLFAVILDVLRTGPSRTPSLHDVEAADAVLVLGEDVTNTAPLLALALRQSVRRKAFEIAKKLNIPAWHDEAIRTATQQERSPLFVASPTATRLDDVAARTFRASPDDIARLGFAVAHELSAGAPPVSGLTEQTRSLAAAIAEALKNAKRPLIVSGTGCGSEEVIHAAAAVASALCENNRKAELCFTVPECNSLGLALMGARNIAEAFSAARQGMVETAILLENDLFRRADAESVSSFFKHVGNSVVLDHLPTATTEKAGIVLPATTFAETDGTLINNEGRMQRFFRVFIPGDDIRESWRWLRDMMTAAGRLEAGEWKSFDDVVSAMAEAFPAFRQITEAAPPATFRATGMKIPRQPHRYSGRTAMHAHISVREPRAPGDPDTPLSFSMEGYEGQHPSPLILRFWAPGWNSVQAITKFQSEVYGPLHGGNPGIRLIEPSPGGKPSYSSDIPAAFQPKTDALLLVPLFHIFGSEELSVLSQAVAGLVPAPYVALNRDDAARIGVNGSEEIELSLPGISRRFPVTLAAGLPQGIGGLPTGLPDLKGILLPAWGRVRKIEGV